MKTRVISGFPGVGKTHAFNHLYHKNDCVWIADSDSSLFSWSSPGVWHPDFPNNYMDHIKDLIGMVDVIFVSSHKVIRDAMVAAGIDFELAYPDRSLKQEYLERYRARGSAESFIQLIDNNWDNFLSELENQEGCRHIVMSANKYLVDYV